MTEKKNISKKSRQKNVKLETQNVNKLLKHISMDNITELKR